MVILAKKFKTKFTKRWKLQQKGYYAVGLMYIKNHPAKAGWLISFKTFPSKYSPIPLPLR